MTQKDERSGTIDYVKRAKEMRDHILNHQDLSVEEVPCPEWELPFPIYVRAMSAKEKDSFEARQFVTDEAGDNSFSLENLRASMLVECVCADPGGKYNIFDGKKDLDALGAKSVAPIDRLLDVSRRLNGSTKEDEKNLLKNLKGQDENSG